MTADHPAHPVIWGNTVEAIGLTKREWLMANAPVPQGLILSALGMDGWSRGLILSQDSSRAAFIALYATVAREMADAIIREAARDG